MGLMQTFKEHILALQNFLNETQSVSAYHLAVKGILDKVNAVAAAWKAIVEATEEWRLVANIVQNDIGKGDTVIPSRG